MLVPGYELETAIRPATILYCIQRKRSALTLLGPPIGTLPCARAHAAPTRAIITAIGTERRMIGEIGLRDATRWPEGLFAKLLGNFVRDLGADRTSLAAGSIGIEQRVSHLSAAPPPVIEHHHANRGNHRDREADLGAANQLK
jgi:hypothetical protein